MIIKGTIDPMQFGRKVYLEHGASVVTDHFVIRTVTPEHPFTPHSHEQEELWYVLKGEAFYQEDGQEHRVTEGDLITIKPWVKHGLRTDSEAVWLCLG